MISFDSNWNQILSFFSENLIEKITLTSFSKFNI